MCVQTRNGSDVDVLRWVHGKAGRGAHLHHRTPLGDNKERSPDPNTDLDIKGIMPIENNSLKRLYSTRFHLHSILEMTEL